jgi:putative hydrolase of the HAD superfamily
MVNWDTVDKVFLDMDGTLLDLNFDNYFWQEHVPQRYAEANDMDLERAKHVLFGLYREAEGTINWYCVDYWTDRLGLNIALLKQEVDHLIAVHPFVVPFLDRVRALDKQAVLVTNAHQKSLNLKMNRTQLGGHLDAIVCAHDFGAPKEEQSFWEQLQSQRPFDPTRTLLIDDSLAVLRSARKYGITNLLAVFQPDTKRPPKDVEEFEAIRSFREITP